MSTPPSMGASCCAHCHAGHPTGAAHARTAPSANITAACRLSLTPVLASGWAAARCAGFPSTGQRHLVYGCKRQSLRAFASERAAHERGRRCCSQILNTGRAPVLHCVLHHMFFAVGDRCESANLVPIPDTTNKIGIRHSLVKYIGYCNHSTITLFLICQPHGPKNIPT